MKIHKPRKMMSRTERAALIFGLVMLLLGVIIGISIRILAAEPSEITITEMSSTQKETQKTKEETGNESQAGDESQIQPCFESETLEGIQPEIQAGAQSEAQTQVAAKNMDSESEGVSEQEAEEETGSERQTVKEVAVETLLQNSCPETETFRTEDDPPNDQTDPPAETGLNGPEPVDDITSHTEEAAAMAVDQDPPLYSVNGAVMPAELQEYLYNRLADCGIGWFMPYAVLIAYQESRFDIYAQNPNGLDKGLFQYRLPYWEEFTAEAGRSGSDIFDPYAQVDVFAFQMARRAFQGFDVNSMISKHNMSDYGPFNQVYVDQVLQHMTVLAAY